MILNNILMNWLRNTSIYNLLNNKISLYINTLMELYLDLDTIENARRNSTLKKVNNRFIVIVSIAYFSNSIIQ